MVNMTAGYPFFKPQCLEFQLTKSFNPSLSETVSAGSRMRSMRLIADALLSLGMQSLICFLNSFLSLAIVKKNLFVFLMLK